MATHGQLRALIGEGFPILREDQRDSIPTLTELEVFPSQQSFGIYFHGSTRTTDEDQKGNPHGLVIRDRYTKLTRAVPMTKITVTKVAQAFIDNWVMPYGIPQFPMPYNGPQFISKFFTEVCALLEVNHLTITEYHPHTNVKTERYNKTLVSRRKIRFTKFDNHD